MKKIAAVLMTIIMMTLSITSLAAGKALTIDEAKQKALEYLGINANEVTCTKAYMDWEDGRKVYELEFFCNGKEYEMDMDVMTGSITRLSKEFHGNYNLYLNGEYDGDFDHDYDHDDLFDWDDMFDWDD